MGPTTVKSIDSFVENDGQLNRLLKEKDISPITTFSSPRYEKEDLREGIETEYYQSFREILQTQLGSEKEGRLIALIKSIKYLATENTKQKIANDLLPLVDKALDSLIDFKQIMDKNTIDYQSKLILLDNALSGTVITIFNTFNDFPNIVERKSQIIHHALYLCDIVREAKPKKETLKYAIYNMLFNNLNKINDLGEHKDHFEDHKGRITRKRTGVEIKYWFAISIVVLIIIIKILTKLF